MILRFLAACIICSVSAAPLQAGIWDKLKSVFVSDENTQPPTIRVLVMHDAPHADIEVKGTYNLYDPYKNKRIATRFSPKGNRVQALSQGLKWGEEFPGIYQIAIIPDDRDIVVSINGKDYRGMVFVYDIGGTISIVNEVEVEDYLSSMMPNKFNRPISEEGLAAAAIAERTHVFHLSMYSENPYWHVRADEVGYQGCTSENSDRRVANALESTRHMVMSKTGVYEGVVTPFPVHLVTGKNDLHYRNLPKISIDDIEVMAHQGDNAAKILAKTFPDASIEIMTGPNRNEEVAQIKISDYTHSR